MSNAENPVCRIKKFNMKCEIERMEINYTFYFFAFFEKPFDIQELRESMSYDEMELDMIGDQRTAMFVIISDTDDTFNFKGF